MNDTTTFLNFIQNHTIQIPLIQRDYVQGLALSEKTREKRDEFVKKLLDALLPGSKPYTLDFIYGAQEAFEDNAQSGKAPFLPLDGQQRLTTLYLLHWILSIKTNKGGCYDSVLELLKKFSYKTRITSDKFCRRLLESQFDMRLNLYGQIKDKTWYVSLETDPTVIAIMEMIKQIESTLALEPYKSNLIEMAANLLKETGQCVTFSILDMERYHLTDGLYVKMNARGKELTPFENWKADFINLISNNEELKNKFTYSIEHEWNDLFWKDVYQKYAFEISETNEKDRSKVRYPRIDEHFLNFFNNYSRLLFFLGTTSDNPKAEDYNEKFWSTTEKLYGDGTNSTQKLFNALDVLSAIDNCEGLDSFFNNLFYTTPSTDWRIFKTSVKLFDNDSVNIFKVCFEDSTFGWQQILLYAILKYCVKYKVNHVTEELKTYTRICRNYLYQHNYLDTGKVSIVAQIRVVEMKTYDKVFDYLCSNMNPIESLKLPFTGEDGKYLDIERKKTSYYECARQDILKLVLKIEDMSYCHGYIIALEDVLNQCIEGTLSPETTWNALLAFIHANNLQKAKLLVACNYKGMTIGNDCAYGKRIFIGGENRWDVHFRKNEAAFGVCLSDYIKAYHRTPDIKSMLDNERMKIKVPTNMRDYMLKYDSVIGAQLRSQEEINYAPFYYAMPNPWKDMDAIVIHSFSNRPLGNSYQTCPMVNAVVRNMCNYNNDHMGFAGRGSEKAHIYIHNGDWSIIFFDMYFTQFDWCVSPDSYNRLSSQLQKKLTPEIGEDTKITCYKLLNTPETDLIEAAKEFMENVVNEFKKNDLLL